MPRRWSTETRAWAYRFLVLRDNEICDNCGDFPTTRNGLDIDHIDGNPHNNEESNLRLLCRTCNVARENRRRAKSPSVQGERVNPRTRVLKQDIPYHEGSAEMQANYLFELDYRTWLLQFIQEHGFINRKEAVNAGAEIVGCNPTTSAKYLAKLVSLAGPLQETKDMLGDVVVTFKPSFASNGHELTSLSTPAARPARRHGGRLSQPSVPPTPTNEQEVK